MQLNLEYRYHTTLLNMWSDAKTWYVVATKNQILIRLHDGLGLSTHLSYIYKIAKDDVSRPFSLWEIKEVSIYNMSITSIHGKKAERNINYLWFIYTYGSLDAIYFVIFYQINRNNFLFYLHKQLFFVHSIIKYKFLKIKIAVFHKLWQFKWVYWKKPIRRVATWPQKYNLYQATEWRYTVAYIIFTHYNSACIYCCTYFRIRRPISDHDHTKRGWWELVFYM